MSFILDALRKSEAERLRKNPPGIASIAEGSGRKSSSKWMWLLLVLLAINLAAVAGLIFRARPVPTASEMPVVTIERAPDEMAVGPADIPADVSREQPVATEVEPQPEVVKRRAETTEAVTGVATIQQAGTVYDGLESFNELRAKGQLALPDLHLDIHVYSGQPEERFVFVNMSKYKENATLSEGPVVREITPEGVVLSYQGTTFLLPRE